MFKRPGSALVVVLAAALAAGGAMLLPVRSAAQDARIVFHEVVVSGGEASLTLELANGDELALALADGQVRVDGSSLGAYEAGGALEGAWRAFLGDAITMDPAALEAALLEWEVPAGSSAAEADAAGQFSGRIASALMGGANAPPAPPPAAGSTAAASIRSFLSGDRLQAIAAIADQLDLDDLTVHVGEAVVVAEGDEIDGSLLVIDGSLDLQGTVDGDVILIGGSAQIGSSGRIDGMLRTAEADVSGATGRISGGVRSIEFDSVVRVDTVVREIVREARSAQSRRSSPFRSFGRGFAGLFQTLVTFAIWFGVGLAVLYFFPRNLEVVSRTARTSPGRSLLVGIAGFILSFPLWIVGIVLLAISIIGIPLLLLWIPLAPVIVVAAATLGVLGVAMNVGRWFSGRELSAFDGFDTSRPAVQLGGGLAALLAAYALANVFEMGGAWFGVFEGLFIAIGVLGSFLAASVGLGAVILSRAGQDRTHASPPGEGQPSYAGHDPA